MSPANRDGGLRTALEHSIQFFGRETARQTHEITNVINIMNELVGLLGDMTAAANSGARPLDPARVEGIVEKLLKQIKRQEAIVRGVNRFSHSVDVIEGLFGIEELNERVTFLAERHVRLSRAELEVDLPQPGASLEGFVLGHQQAVLTALELALESGGAGQALRLSYAPAEGRVTITVEAEVEATCDEKTVAATQELESLVDLLGGRLDSLPEPGRPLRIGMSFAQARVNSA